MFFNLPSKWRLQLKLGRVERDIGGERDKSLGPIREALAVMMHEFLTENRRELIERCRMKVARQSLPSFSFPLFAEGRGILIFV